MSERKHGNQRVDYDDAMANPELAEKARKHFDTPLVRAAEDALLVVASEFKVGPCEEDCCYFPGCIIDGCEPEPQEPDEPTKATP